MDDEDSKARRNFMAVSAIIVLAWWLQAPLDKISEKLLGMPSVGAGFEWRAWFAGLCALLYFALRFRFSERQQQSAKELQDESVDVRDRLLARWLRWEIAAWNRWRLRGPVIGQSLEKAVESVLELNGGEVLKVSTSEISPGRTNQEGARIANSRVAVRAVVSVFIATSTPRPLGMAGTHVDVHANLTTSQRFILTAWEVAWLVSYSKASTALFVPWALGAAAAAVCAWRIAQAM